MYGILNCLGIEPPKLKKDIVNIYESDELSHVATMISRFVGKLVGMERSALLCTFLPLMRVLLK